MPTRTVRIDEDLDQRLVALAAKLDRSVNWLMVKAAQAYVAAAHEVTPADVVTLTDEGREALQADRLHHPTPSRERQRHTEAAKADRAARRARPDPK